MSSISGTTCRHAGGVHVPLGTDATEGVGAAAEEERPRGLDAGGAWARDVDAK